MTQRPTITRRGALVAVGSLAAAGALGVAGLARSGSRPGVFLARGQRYDGPLEQTIRDGLLAVGIDPHWCAGRSVLLKPNMVEPTRAIPHMTTHPAMIVAAAEVFRGWGASVTVGEGPGHVRDTEAALIDSGVGAALEAARLPFADLNYQRVAWKGNRGGFSKLPGLWLPQSVVSADLVVSMPKLKTHHWVGMTAAMKNLYGVIPGIKYGWPKNVLHHNGIPETVSDINCTLPRVIGVVDAIDCMEGDGPILGSRKHLGAVAVGADLTALDATLARVIGLAPEKIAYLALASRKLGPIADGDIEQRGESWESLASPFHIIDLPFLQELRAGEKVT